MADALLFIGGTAVDLGEDTLVQLTIKQEDYTNPAIVRSSFSRTITLPDTPTNNALFGWIARGDYHRGTFDTYTRTPFILYDKNGLVVESGYCKLDKVTRKGNATTYGVTLFGGLGSFIYRLAQDENGKKKSLADLDYGQDLSFTLNKEAIAEAWANGAGGKWGVINFAPVYPDKVEDFDANKVLVDVAGAAALYSRPIIPAGIPTREGKVLVEMAKEMNEWQMADLRSYLQHPVVSVRELFAALGREAAKGGTTLTLDERFFNDGNPYFANEWMTLPRIEGGEGDEVERVLAFPAELYTGGVASLPITLSEGFAPAVKSKSSLTISLQANADGAIAHATQTGAGYSYDNFEGVFVQVVAVDADGRDCGYSDVSVVAGIGIPSPERVAAAVGYTPKGNGVRYINGGGVFENGLYSNPLTLSVEGYGVNGYRVELCSFYYIVGTELDPFGYVVDINYGHLTGRVTNTDGAALSIRFLNGGAAFTEEGQTGLRSGQRVTQATLFDGTPSPADFLLSYCKAFGLFIVKSPTADEVRIFRRDTYFNGGVVDISDRVNIAEAMDVTPIAAPTRYLSFSAASGGEIGSDYQKRNGRDYGSLVVNTGYDFDRETTDVTKGNVLRGGVMVTDAGEDYSTPVSLDGEPLLNWEVYGYTITDGDGEEMPVAPVFYERRDYWGGSPYDYAPKLSLTGDKDGSCVLLFRVPSATYGEGNTFGYRVSDDTPLMLEMNDGKACWLLSSLDDDCLEVTPPIFSRNLPTAEDSGEIERTMDYAVPTEVFDKTIRAFGELSTIGEQYWGAFLGDRYGQDARRVTCKVRLDGVQVSGEMLRRFYYFDGALWALLSINDYAPSKSAAASCEFIRVSNPTAYGVSAHKPALRVSAAALLVGYTQSIHTIEVTSNEAWTIEGGSDFVTLSTRAGGVDEVQTTTAVNLDVAANYGNAVRFASLLIRTTSGLEWRVTIRQNVRSVYAVVMNCTRCGACLPACPYGAITMGADAATIDEGRCVACGICADVCPEGAIWNII
jgi:ferredoxin